MRALRVKNTYHNHSQASKAASDCHLLAQRAALLARDAVCQLPLPQHGHELRDLAAHVLEVARGNLDSLGVILLQNTAGGGRRQAWVKVRQGRQLCCHRAALEFLLRGEQGSRATYSPKPTTPRAHTHTHIPPPLLPASHFFRPPTTPFRHPPSPEQRSAPSLG